MRRPKRTSGSLLDGVGRAAREDLLKCSGRLAQVGAHRQHGVRTNCLMRAQGDQTFPRQSSINLVRRR